MKETFVCSKCGKEKKKVSSSGNDGLCGKCRSYANRKKYDKRKNKPCPGCGKLIINTSSLCHSCNQKGERNRIYKDGSCTSTGRFCIDCGKEIKTPKAKRCSECHFKNFPKGEDSPQYKDGRSMNRIFKSPEYIQWRIDVMTRDNNTCQMCGFFGKNRVGLQAHHILPRRDYQELKFVVSNGITLCKSCHKLTYNKEYQFVDLFLEKLGRSKTP